MGSSNGNSGIIDVALATWFLLTLASVLYVAYDAVRNNPELTVMKWGWVLVTLYTGLVGAVLYVLSCKEPGPGEHARFVAPIWKQALGSTIYCMARHINHYITNDGVEEQGGGGLMMIINVVP